MRKTLLLGVLGLAALAGAAAAADTLSDSQVLGIYIQVNSFDVETALLARVASEISGRPQSRSTCRVRPRGRAAGRL